MARPRKEGLTYFPLDVTTGVGDEVELLEAEYGLCGFAVYIKLLQAIYKAGYFISWTQKEQLLFSKRVSCSGEQIQKIIASCMAWGLFDRGLYEQYAILTSHGIQQRFLLAVERRSGIEMKAAYLLVTEKEVSAAKTKVNVTKTPESAAVMPQIEREREKEKETESQRETEREKTAPLPLSDYQDLCLFYEKAYGSLPGRVRRSLKHLWEAGMSKELIYEAVTLAALRHKPNPHYAVGICSSLLQEGILTLADYERSKAYGEHGADHGRSLKPAERTRAECLQLGYQPEPGEAEEELPF